MLRSTLVADVSFCFALLCFNIKYFFSRFVSTERNALDSLANAFIVKNSFLMRTTQMAQYLLPGAYDFSSNITIFSNENRTHTANTRPNTFYMDMTEFDENENTILVRMKWKKRFTLKSTLNLCVFSATSIQRTVYVALGFSRIWKHFWNLHFHPSTSLMWDSSLSLSTHFKHALIFLNCGVVEPNTFPICTFRMLNLFSTLMTCIRYALISAPIHQEASTYEEMNGKNVLKVLFPF